MDTQHLDLLPAAPGVLHRLQVLRFGTPGRGPKAVIQAALHADEVPGILVVHALRERLQALEADGALLGEVLLLPFANPLGLTQHLMGQHQGRFDLADGINFNRGHAELGRTVAAALAGQLGSDAAANVERIRAALREAAAALPAATTAQDLKRRLVQLAIDADIVLDLHCDAQAVMHVYALTPQADLATELGALLGARAVLLATESGDSPFDEACSRPWLDLQQHGPQAAVPLACFSATVELRGEADTDPGLARQDADALLAFLCRRGVVAGTLPPLPPLRCVATPLAGSEPVTAPTAGVVVFHAEPGAQIQAGQLVAEVVDAATGARTPLHAASAGVLYARTSTRWATPGKRLAKIAGTAVLRSGKLLSP
jgi:predicted deacylase